MSDVTDPRAMADLSDENVGRITAALPESVREAVGAARNELQMEARGLVDLMQRYMAAWDAVCFAIANETDPFDNGGDLAGRVRDECGLGDVEAVMRGFAADVADSIGLPTDVRGAIATWHAIANGVGGVYAALSS